MSSSNCCSYLTTTYFFAGIAVTITEPASVISERQHFARERRKPTDAADLSFVDNEDVHHDAPVVPFVFPVQIPEAFWIRKEMLWVVNNTP